MIEVEIAGNSDAKFESVGFFIRADTHFPSLARPIDRPAASKMRMYRSRFVESVVAYRLTRFKLQYLKRRTFIVLRSIFFHRVSPAEKSAFDRDGLSREDRLMYKLSSIFRI